MRTRANKRVGVSRRACKIGIANAPVFPEPVSASPIISFPEWSQLNIVYILYNYIPASARGNASRWILVGVVHFIVLHASQRTSVTPYCNYILL